MVQNTIASEPRQDRKKRVERPNRCDVYWIHRFWRVQSRLKHSGIRPRPFVYFDLFWPNRKTFQIAFSEHAHVRLLHEGDRHVGVPTGRHRRLI